MTKKFVRGLVKIKRKKSGRDSRGHISVRHQGGEHRRYLRLIDWKRNKRDVAGTVAAVEYDPNRNAPVALVHYIDGEKRYILATANLKAGDKVLASEKAEVKEGNAMPLSKIPVGIRIHNLEIIPGKGGQVVRGAGGYALIQSKDKKRATIKLASGEVKLFPINCWATIGQVGNVSFSSKKLRKAGDKRHRGIRPTVRGVSQHPNAHPHGGGEGKSGIGMPSPKSPWGKRTLGKKTRKRKRYSNKWIVKRRK